MQENHLGGFADCLQSSSIVLMYKTGIFSLFEIFIKIYVEDFKLHIDTRHFYFIVVWKPSQELNQVKYAVIS